MKLIRSIALATLLIATWMTSEPAYAAPPATQRSIAVDELRALVGQSFDTAQLMAFSRSIPYPPTFASYSGVTIISYKTAGLSFNFAGDGKTYALRAVFLYAEGQDQFNAYPGILPGGVTFDDRRRAVEKKLGRPESSSTGILPYEAMYPSLGLDVQYQKEDGFDPENPIKAITLFKPDPAPPATQPVNNSITLLRITDGPPRDGRQAPVPLPLDATHFESLLAMPDRQGVPQLYLRFTKEGAKLLNDEVESHPGAYLTIYIGGVKVAMAQASAKIERDAVVPLSPGVDVRDCDKMLRRLDVVIHALPPEPATRPAKANQDPR